MTSTQSFEELVWACEQQLNRPRLAAAMQTAKTLTARFPQEPKSWLLYNLIVCLRNSRGGAASRSPKIIKIAQRRLGDAFTPKVHGDMLRDQGLSLTTYGTRAQLARIPELLAQIRELHAGDPNRLACAVDLEARYYFARGNAEAAIELHGRADKQWRDMGELADRVWIANNKIRLLRACVAKLGAGHVIWLRDEIIREFPDKKQQAKILTGPMGLRIFTAVLKHR